MDKPRKTGPSTFKKKKEVQYAKPEEFTPEQWKTLTQKESLFPEHDARAAEILSKIKWMKDQ